jgi:hypothetical protein
MAKGRRGTTFAVILLLLPLLSVISYEMGVDFAPAASAASDCGHGEQPGALDENMVEDFKLTGSGWFGDDENWGSEEGWSQSQDLTNRDLSSLTSSFYTSSVLNNDSAFGLRMNLTTGWKYTICVDLQPLNGSNERPIADVYLMQEDDFSQYEFDFESRHNDWGGMRDDLAHSAPWLQNLILWHPFRDVHSYEKLDAVEFAVALDHEERSYSIWDDYSKPKTMFLMIESWNNIRDYDAKPQGANYSVDVTVLVEERFSLPNWTVSIVCCGGLLGILASPFLVHRRYMKAGLVTIEAGGGDMMPHLETEPERPPSAAALPEPPKG